MVTAKTCLVRIDVCAVSVEAKVVDLTDPIVCLERQTSVRSINSDVVRGDGSIDCSPEQKVNLEDDYTEIKTSKSLHTQNLRYPHQSKNHV